MCRPTAPSAKAGSAPFQFRKGAQYSARLEFQREIMSKELLAAGLRKVLDIPRNRFGGPGAGDGPGFTLTELLILIGVFTLMAVAAVPAYSYFLRSEGEQGPLVSRPTALLANAEVQAAELLTVQRAMDGMMASSQIVEVEPSPMHGTDNFEALPSGAGAEPLYPGFLRTEAGFTDCVYMWTSMGQVYQFTCP